MIDPAMLEPTILIIDDSESVRSHVKQVLADHCVGAKVLIASDGIEGFKLLLAAPADLVLCDLEMPGIDGFKFLGLKQSKVELREIPTIMLTSHEGVRSKVRGLEAGASDYLVKPIHDEELVARCKVHLRMKALQDELREKNLKLEELSRTDGLTKITNRRHLIEVLELEFLRAERYDTPLSYVMADIDHFKKLNDAHGHQIGDQALIEVSSAIKNNIRQHDLVGRYGGEEFGVLLPQTDIEGAVAVAERCRVEVAALTISAPSGAVTLSVSMGVACRTHPLVKKPADLIRLADDALYEAKRTGRNRVLAAPEPRDGGGT